MQHILAPFIYETLERILLPFGLHHMLTIPMNYTSFGGTYTIATGLLLGVALARYRRVDADKKDKYR